MADDRTYRIIIDLSSIPKGNEAMANVEQSMAGGNLENSSGAAAIKKAEQLVSFATMASTSDKIISSAISEVSLGTGAVEYEQRLNASYNIVAKPILSLAYGALTGTLPLVAMGMVISGFNRALSVSQKAVQINAMHSFEDISIEMQSIRAGVSGRRGSNQ